MLLIGPRRILADRERRRALRVGIVVLACLVVGGGVWIILGRLFPQHARTTDRPTVVFLGDSWAEASQVPADESFVEITSRVMGWRPVNLSEGGTGYVNPGPATVDGLTTFPERIPQVVAADPDVVVVLGGLNDAQARFSAAELSRAASRTLDGLQKALPHASVVAVGPFWPDGRPPAEALAVDGEVRSAAAEHDVAFLDPIREHWITGTRGVASSGNRSQYIGPDDVHPTAAGHAYIADRLVADLRARGLVDEQ